MLAASGQHPSNRPPAAMDIAPPPGAVSRPSVRSRPLVTVRASPTTTGLTTSDPYVRRYWTAVVGPTAVADLLRLSTAAIRGDQILRPYTTSILARENLAWFQGKELRVVAPIPYLGASQVRRLPPALRAEHEAEVRRRAWSGRGRRTIGRHGAG